MRLDGGNQEAEVVAKEFEAKFGKKMITEQNYRRNVFSCRFALESGDTMTKEEINWLEVRLTLSGFEAPPEGMTKS